MRFEHAWTRQFVSIDLRQFLEPGHCIRDQARIALNIAAAHDQLGDALRPCRAGLGVGHDEHIVWADDEPLG